MRVFVTGASGWVGSAVVPELISHGHQVLGLARSDASADKIAAAGGEVLRGELTDLDALRAGARDADGVIHLAFNHEIAFTGDMAGAADQDLGAINAFGEVMTGTDKPLIITSGTGALAPGQVATESVRGGEEGAGRMHNENVLLGLADQGIRTSVVRLPPTTHGAGDNGFMAIIVKAARDSGFSAYIGDGLNRWAAVHRSDAAVVYRKVLESAPAGTIAHAVAEEGVAIQQVAQLIGRGLGIPVQSITADEAPGHFGFLARFVGADIPASSLATQQLLGWKAVGPTLVADLESGAYFA